MMKFSSCGLSTTSSTWGVDARMF